MDLSQLNAVCWPIIMRARGEGGLNHLSGPGPNIYAVCNVHNWIAGIGHLCLLGASRSQLCWQRQQHEIDLIMSQDNKNPPIFTHTHREIITHTQRAQKKGLKQTRSPRWALIMQRWGGGGMVGPKEGIIITKYKAGTWDALAARQGAKDRQDEQTAAA